MQRWCSKLRSFAAIPKCQQPHFTISSSSSPTRLLHNSSNPLISSYFKPLFNASSPPSSAAAAAVHPHFSLFNHSSMLSPSLMQVRHITAKQRKKKLKSRQPRTPIVSKVKKTKMKCYSSFKGRFRLMKTGEYRRWKEGKQHNAHLKSKKAKRRLRKPGTVPLAYAKVMKKLNFRG